MAGPFFFSGYNVWKTSRRRAIVTDCRFSWLLLIVHSSDGISDIFRSQPYNRKEIKWQMIMPCDDTQPRIHPTTRLSLSSHKARQNFRHIDTLQIRRHMNEEYRAPTDFCSTHPQHSAVRGPRRSFREPLATGPRPLRPASQPSSHSPSSLDQ